ncbi:Predicted transcriptional regulators [Pasteurella testudinis DSM 23072]|uniref:Predicted transcriptional regulators n=1 Tax=Pasteurella testudinis DSM 23072 TaxID=1122938 RepID=A0A1W1V5B0_9PAST|nr:ParB/Srx family N-terminal domain-containing protein [Pasteurella testudinis]SMB88483.1 Predicted transcriptional regulators [Pasteurella testudinis DSM 23072]SUB51622.1 ParB/RepB/Spo0J family partition protein [Pasteurella testudinis]
MSAINSSNLSIEQINIDDLLPYVNNSRTHSGDQVSQIAASIKEFGFCNPVLIDDDNGIIAGHGRLMAAKKLNFETVPAVRLIGLSEAQKKAYVIADNQLALNADWDLSKLQIEIEALQESNFDIDLLGFDDEFLSDLIGDEQDLAHDDVVAINDEQKNILMIEFDSEWQLQEAYEIYSGKGLKCKILE